MLGILRIKETCLYFDDLEQAHMFYHGTLGLPVISYLKGKHIFFRAGESVLLCFNPSDSRGKSSPPAHFGEGKYHFAFEVAADNYEQQKSTLEAKGILITDKIIWGKGQESFYFEDPAGNVVEIIPEGIWEQG